MVRWRSIVRCMNQMHEQRTARLRWGPRLLRDLVNAHDLATAAAPLACAGVPVFPCVPGCKRPLTVYGYQDANIDRGTVTAWWGRHPDANIGVPAGLRGGIDVVDVDVHERGSGFASFNKARRAGFIEGWSYLVRTPSGGLHAAPAPQRRSLSSQLNGASVPESVGNGSQLARQEGRCVDSATILQPRAGGHLDSQNGVERIRGRVRGPIRICSLVGEPSGRPIWL